MKKPNKSTRREFIRKSALAALGVTALPAIVPASALGRDGHTAPSNRIVMGCIGWGQMGPGDTLALAQSDRVQFVAMSDVDRPRREEAKKRIEQFYAEKSPSGSYKGCDTYNLSLIHI